jgi:hypothetical protein
MLFFQTSYSSGDSFSTPGSALETQGGACRSRPVRASTGGVSRWARSPIGDGRPPTRRDVVLDSWSVVHCLTLLLTLPGSAGDVATHALFRIFPSASKRLPARPVGTLGSVTLGLPERLPLVTLRPGLGDLEAALGWIRRSGAAAVARRSLARACLPGVAAAPPAA